MSKIEIGLAVSVADLKLKPTSQALNAFATELRERAEAVKKPKEAPVKKQFVFVPYPMGNLLSDALDGASTPEERLMRCSDAADKSESGWVLQVPEDDNLSNLWERVNRAISDFNRSPRGRKIPVKSLPDAFEFIPARFWKEHKIWIKTKDAVLKVHAPWRAQWGKVEE